MRPGNRNIIYKILWPIVWLYFKIVYHPKSVNKVEIPKDGPIILCSNHIHTHDQFMILSHTTRVVHYLAKKEYFDGKFGFFFRAVGCIPVDRKIKDENAKNEAVDILRHGNVIGLFPEGTRNIITCKKDRVVKLLETFNGEYNEEEMVKLLDKNQTRVSQVDLLDKLKEEKKITLKEYKLYVLNIWESLERLYNEKIITKEEYENSILLPFKYGAVSMAQKTNATIIPFAIYGKYKFTGNSLRSKMGIPFKIENMSLEEANERLFNEIKTLIYDLKKRQK